MQSAIAALLRRACLYFAYGVVACWRQASELPLQGLIS